MKSVKLWMREKITQIVTQNMAINAREMMPSEQWGGKAIRILGGLRWAKAMQEREEREKS